MSESKFTPGPFKVGGSKLGAIQVLDTDGRAVAAVYLRERKGEEDANAHLFAAAPAMFEALEEALFNPLRECEQTEGLLTRLHVNGEDEARMRAALSLARGEGS